MRCTFFLSKRLFFLFAVLLALCFIPVTAYAADGETFVVEDISYQVISDQSKTARVVEVLDSFKYKAKLGKVEIPATVADSGISYDVIEIGAFCFADNGNFIELILPDSITVIGDYAFANCTLLESLEIPDGVKSLHGNTVSGCWNLRSIVLPSSLEFLDNSDGVFYGCESLEEISIVNSNIFRTIDGVLYGNILNDEQDEFGGYLFNGDMYTLIRYPPAKPGPFVIPDSVEVVGQFAFHGTLQIGQIDIPTSVKHLRKYCFRGMENWVIIAFHSETPPVISTAFSNTGRYHIYVPSEAALTAYAKGGAGISPGGSVRVEVNPNSPNPGGSDPGNNNSGGGSTPAWVPPGSSKNPDYSSTGTTSDFRSLQGALENAIQAANAANSGTVSLQLKNFKSLDHDTLKQIAAAAKAAGKSCTLSVDTLEGGTVQVRMMFNPANATKAVQLTGSVNSNGAKRVDSLFERNFQNKVQVIELGQQGSFGMTVSIAAKLNLTEFNTKRLYFYNYDKTANTYSRIKNPKNSIDKNNFLWFNTTQAGYVIITDKPLSRNR